MGFALPVDVTCFIADQSDAHDEYNETFEQWVGVTCAYRGPVLLVASDPLGCVINWQERWSDAVRDVLRRCVGSCYLDFLLSLCQYRLVSMRPVGLAISMQVLQDQSHCRHVNRTRKFSRKKGGMGCLPLELMFYIISYCSIPSLQQLTLVNPLYKGVVRSIMKNSVNAALSPFFEGLNSSVHSFLYWVAEEKGYVCGDVALAMDRGRYDLFSSLHVTVPESGARGLVFWLANIGYSYAEISDNELYSSRSITLESEKVIFCSLRSATYDLTHPTAAESHRHS